MSIHVLFPLAVQPPGRSGIFDLCRPRKNRHFELRKAFKAEKRKMTKATLTQMLNSKHEQIVLDIHFYSCLPD